MLHSRGFLLINRRFIAFSLTSANRSKTKILFFVFYLLSNKLKNFTRNISLKMFLKNGFQCFWKTRDVQRNKKLPLIIHTWWNEWPTAQYEYCISRRKFLLICLYFSQNMSFELWLRRCVDSIYTRFELVYVTKVEI